MKYSALMAVYYKDDPSAFRQAIQSLVDQTVQPEEIVIVNDGLIGRDLLNVLDELKSTGLIRRVSLPINVGLGPALNAGLQVCKNNLVARMDSDDISLPNRCELQLKEFEQDSTLDIVGSSVAEFEDDPKNIVSYRVVPTTNKEIYNYARKRNPFNHPTVMYKRDTLFSIGGYRNCILTEDIDLWFRLLSKHANCKNLKEPLLLFRFNSGTIDRRVNWLSTSSLIKVFADGYKYGVVKLLDLIWVTAGLLFLFCLPRFVYVFIYKRILRKCSF